MSRVLVLALLVLIVASCGKKKEEPVAEGEAKRADTQGDPNVQGKNPVLDRKANPPKISAADFQVAPGGSVLVTQEPRTRQQSLRMRTAPTRVNQVAVNLPSLKGQPLRALQAVQYQVYLSSNIHRRHDHYSVNLNVGVDLDCNGTADDTLILEPMWVRLQSGRVVPFPIKEWVLVGVNRSSAMAFYSANDDLFRPSGPVILPGSSSTRAGMKSLGQATTLADRMSTCRGGASQIANVTLSLGQLNNAEFENAEAFVKDIQVTVGGAVLKYAL